MMSKYDKHIGFKTDTELKKEIEEKAEQLNITKSVYIRGALKLFNEINTISNNHKLIRKIRRYIHKHKDES